MRVSRVVKLGILAVALCGLAIGIVMAAGGSAVSQSTAAVTGPKVAGPGSLGNPPLTESVGADFHYSCFGLMLDHLF